MPEGGLRSTINRSPTARLREVQSNHPHLLLTLSQCRINAAFYVVDLIAPKPLFDTKRSATALSALPFGGVINSVLPLMPDWVQSASPYIIAAGRFQLPNRIPR